MEGGASDPYTGNVQALWALCGRTKRRLWRATSERHRPLRGRTKRAVEMTVAAGVRPGASGDVHDIEKLLEYRRI
jgi:hypothetical protein